MSADPDDIARVERGLYNRTQFWAWYNNHICAKAGCANRTRLCCWTEESAGHWNEAYEARKTTAQVAVERVDDILTEPAGECNRKQCTIAAHCGLKHTFQVSADINGGVQG